MVRFYDKVAEYKEQLRRLQRKRSKDAEPLTLEGEFGVAPNAVITRVERQFGAQRIPNQIDTVAKLLRLAEFNPFTNIEIATDANVKLPTIEECGFDAWCTGMWLRQIRDEMGSQQFRRYLSKYTNGNSSRYLKKYANFLHPSGDRKVTVELLVTVFQDSVRRQLVA